MAQITLSDKRYDVFLIADRYIPHVWGSLREAWMKGFINQSEGFFYPPLWARNSACAVYYRKGKEAAKEEKGRTR